MQCDAKYELYDKDGNLIVTFFCTREKDHDGDHEQTLYWTEDIHESIMGA